jgi:glycosyltransferase involved in cell wall biosynthesis
LVDDGLGQLVPPGDPAALAGAIAHVLDRGAPDRAAISRRVLARHGLEAVGARWSAIYDAVLRERARRTSST